MVDTVPTRNTVSSERSEDSSLTIDAAGGSAYTGP
jgi:hypothetical protein